jgi:ribose transport system ATP-binding protein
MTAGQVNGSAVELVGVELRDIWKSFGGLAAVRGASLRVTPGEVVGLIGANGAGKSTLMRILAGAIEPDSGSILRDGEKRLFHSPRHALREGIALVPQELDLVHDQSIAENLFLGQLPARAGVIRRKTLRAAAVSALAKVGLHVDPDLPVSSLTLVEQRLVSIAEALAKGARLIILDEPTAALPADTAAMLQPLIAELATDGTALIYVSHRLDEIKAVCSRVVAMRDGCVAGELRGHEIDVERMVVLVGGSSLEPEAVALRRTGMRRILEMRGVAGRKISDLDLSVYEGEILGVGGLYGSGRSELLRLMAGAQRPAAGSVELEGRPAPRAPVAAVRRGVGYVAEGRASMLFGDISTAANASITILDRLSWGGMIIRSRRERAAVAEVSERVRLKGEPGAAVRTLSGGNQQKVCLARWLLRGSSFLVLDEPTVGIDVHARAEIHRLLRELAEGGTTIVVASAEPEELALLCHRVIVLAKGRIVSTFESPMTPESVVRASYASLETTYEGGQR